LFGICSNKKHILILPSFAVNISQIEHKLEKKKIIMRKDWKDKASL